MGNIISTSMTYKKPTGTTAECEFWRKLRILRLRYTEQLNLFIQNQEINGVNHELLRRARIMFALLHGAPTDKFPCELLILRAAEMQLRLWLEIDMYHQSLRISNLHIRP